VVAGRDIAAGDALTDDDVTVSQIAADSAPAEGFSDTSALDGRVAAAPIVKGQAILEPLLAPKGSGSGLQAAIPQGMRALTIDVNEISGVAGYITPGSRVDILQPFRDLTNQPIERFIVQNVPVTAVGVKGSLTADQNTAHSVTLLVTPRQAALIDLATANGRPRLVLRNTLDKESPLVPTITLTELTGGSVGPLTVVPQPPVEVVAPIHTGIDPFAPTTRPAPVVDAEWRMRVITAGESGEVDVHLPKLDNPVTHTDTNDVNNP
jgi:pilus assembly protein CpaB